MNSMIFDLRKILSDQDLSVDFSSKILDTDNFNYISGKKGLYLSEWLDDLSCSNLFALALSEVDQNSSFDSFLKDPINHLVDIAVSYEFVSKIISNSIILPNKIDGSNLMAKFRSYLRRSSRGFMALLNLPFASDDGLRYNLIEHIAVGIEVNLLIGASVLTDINLARESLSIFGLKTLDIAALKERQKNIEETRALLNAIKKDMPNFLLPPDANFRE